MLKIEEKIKSLGIEIPKLSMPIANYVPYKIINNILYVSGQGPIIDGKVMHEGKVGPDISVEDGIEAARICCLNILSVLKHSINNDWDKFEQIIKLGGFVNCNPDFKDQPKIINGCSDLLVEYLGEKGKHARSALGVYVLPNNIPVEIEAIIEIKTNISNDLVNLEIIPSSGE